MSGELDALRTADFNWTRSLQDIWVNPPFHIEDLNKSTAAAILDEFERGVNSTDWNPIGQIIQGSAGSGKTHLVGSLRRRVWEKNGWFVLIDITGLNDFWRTAALSFVNSLQQKMDDGLQQRRALLNAVLRKMFADPGVRAGVGEKAEPKPLSREKAVDLYLGMLRRFDPFNARRHQDVVRALILLDSDAIEEADFAFSWMQGESFDDDLRRKLKFAIARAEPVDIVRGILWVMSLVGPTMIAIDQIDAVVSNANVAALGEPADPTERFKANQLVQELAKGLIELHDVKRRALVVISCLQVTWPIVTRTAIEPLTHRFVALPVLRSIDSPGIVARLIGDRMALACKSVGYVPRYPTWPFRDEAIQSAVGMRPRMVLMRCQEHRRAGLSRDQVFECLSLETATAPTPEPADDGRRKTLDTLFERERAAADPVAFGRDEAAAATQLMHVCELLLGHFHLPDSIDAEVKPDPNRKTAALHASLSFVFHDQGDRQERWCFRWLPQDNALAFQARLKAAMTASGIEAGLNFRHLTILRDGPAPSGQVTQQLVALATKAGAKFVALAESDKRVFLALIALAELNPPGFEEWLSVRRPLFQTGLFKLVGLAPPHFLAEPTAKEVPHGEEPAPSLPQSSEPPLRPSRPTAIFLKRVPVADVAAAKPTESTSPAALEIPIGRRWERGAPGAQVSLPTGALPRHIALLAGTGSGKTVLLRRIVEEAALIGIPAIVLDVNNDLARLGEPWPSPPPSFDSGESAKAEAYFARAEVVVWTPGAHAGNPLSLRLLPDFAAIREGSDDKDARDEAIQMALATLSEILPSSGRKGKLMNGVLADALSLFALKGGSLDELITDLSDLDPDASRITDAPKIAREIADLLNAAVATNPLLKSNAPPLDIDRLFTGDGVKARISVINLAGLGSDAARQDFVNRLQMALFTWIKQNPSPTGRLYVLDEAQNFAPSTTATACKASALALIAQARKYGLGMVLATQQPKGIDNKIVSNCATHVYGRMASPTAITAIEEMMAAKGGRADDIGRLTAGEFYYSTASGERPVKIRTPLCLSWHPANPPTAEEVIEIARRRRG